MCPEELPQTDGDSDELARADGKEDDAEPGLRGAATRNPPSPFDSADGTAEWLLIAEKVGRRFLLECQLVARHQLDRQSR